MTIQEYCDIAGEILGKTPIYEPISKSYPIWPDTSKMQRLLGPCKVSMREGIRRLLQTSTDARVHVRTPR
jgi:UDP-glucuronate 4-epimerase